MTVRQQWRALIVLASMALAAALSTSARADEIPVITGEHWGRSSEELKKVYLIGIANVVQIEAAYEAANPPTDAQSIVPRLVKGMKRQTLDSVREGLNKWYAAHPEQMQRPVIETIWFEMVLPELRKTN